MSARYRATARFNNSTDGDVVGDGGSVRWMCTPTAPGGRGIVGRGIVGRERVGDVDVRTAI